MTAVRTFIVEDNPVILENLVATLEELTDVKVVASAADEATALRHMRDHAGEFDLMIVDIFLKSGSGIGVLRAALEAGLPVYRIVLTNYATDDIRKRCAALGADRVFDKSGELEHLIVYCARIADGAATQPGALN